MREIVKGETLGTSIAARSSAGVCGRRCTLRGASWRWFARADKRAGQAVPLRHECLHVNANADWVARTTADIPHANEMGPIDPS